MPNYKRYYIPNSMVFITIVTNNRLPILINNIDLLKEAIRKTRYRFQIFAGVIMPEHIHIILAPKNIKELPKIISSIKYYFSRNLSFPEYERRDSQIKRREKGVWQRRYYDHVIRNEADLNRHLDYIHYNPVKHKLAKTPAEWKYSSFSKFVKVGLYENSWCNFEDKNKISEIDLE